jgi:threonine dehydrogenase-like Zn-dependent dehydrogenase
MLHRMEACCVKKWTRAASAEGRRGARQDSLTATGVVSAVGPDVTEVAPGDTVILNWRAVCGQCRACAKGQPQYCFDTHNATP